jgi:hypothetical protein
MRCSHGCQPHLPAAPTAPNGHTRVSRVWQAERLFNERLCLMVVGRGDSWVEYSLAVSVAPNLTLWLLMLLALLIVAGAALLLRGRRSPVPPKRPPD